jgi:hypothetical protein
MRTNKLGPFERISTIPQQEILSPTLNAKYYYDDTYKSAFLETIFRSGEEYNDLSLTIEEAIALREKFLNFAFRSDPTLVTGDPISLLKSMEQGKSLYCDGLADIYGLLLDSIGFRTRRVVLQRSVFDIWDSHVSIEVYDEVRKKWILSDPTFNVSFLMDGEFQSASELYEIIHSGRIGQVQRVHGKKTRYEYSISDYYINYYSLFDNLIYSPFVPSGLQQSLTAIPPIRWLDDRRVWYLYISELRPVRSNEVLIHSWILFIVMMLLPLSIFGSGLIAIVGLLVARKRPMSNAYKSHCLPSLN